MLKERGLLLLVVFLLLQAPLALFFSKKGSFDELKGKIVISELALVSLFVLSVSLVRSSSVAKTVSSRPLIRVKEESLPSFSEEEVENLKKEKDFLEQEAKETKKQLEELQKLYNDQDSRLQAQLAEAEKFQVEFPSELFSFLQQAEQMLSEALFSELEEMQEVRRQHMIEMRALLKKEPLGGPAAFEKKTILSSLPRGIQNPVVLLFLVKTFAQKLSLGSEQKSDAKSFVRRKFFDEVRAVKTISFVCLSVDTPTETIAPLPYLPSDVKILSDFVRPKMHEKNSTFLLENQGERWFIQQLSEPFFEDVFLCFKWQSRN